MIIIFHTNEYNDTTKYDNWSFSNMYLFDDFWFSSNNTILYWSEVFVIGESALDLAQIPCVPELNIYKDTNVTMKIFGIPVIKKDVTENKILYTRAPN